MSDLGNSIRERLAGTDLSGVFSEPATAVPAEVAPLAVEPAPATPAAAEPAASVTPADTTIPGAPETPNPTQQEAPVSDDPLLAEIRSRFASKDDIEPFIGLVDAAASTDPQVFDQQLRQLLGDERYVQQVLTWAEANRSAIEPMFTPPPVEVTGAAAEFDPELFPADDESARALMVKAQQVAAEAERLKAENDALRAAQAAQPTPIPAPLQANLDKFETTVISPMAAIEAAKLPTEAQERIELEVMTKLQREFGSDLQQIQQRMLKGESPAVFGKAAIAMQQAVQKWTAEALAYHGKVATATAPGLPEKAIAAAQTTAVVEPLKAAAIAPVAPAQPAQQPERKLNSKDQFAADLKAKVAAAIAQAGLR